jgi:hypothetical protein
MSRPRRLEFKEINLSVGERAGRELNLPAAPRTDAGSLATSAAAQCPEGRREHRQRARGNYVPPSAQPTAGVRGWSPREKQARRPGAASTAHEPPSSCVGEEGFEPSHPRVFPDFVLEYAGWGGIPKLGISCGHGNGRGPAPVKRFADYELWEPPGTGLECGKVLAGSVAQMGSLCGSPTMSL